MIVSENWFTVPRGLSSIVYLIEPSRYLIFLSVTAAREMLQAQWPAFLGVEWFVGY